MKELGLRYRVLILAGFVLILWLLHRELNLPQYFTGDRIGPTVDAVRSWVAPYGAWGPAVFAAVCSLAMLANLPSALIICLSVFLFGYGLGGVLSFIIIGAGLSLVYAVAQWLGRPLVKQLFGRSLEKVEALVTRRELLNVIVVRLIFYMNPASNWILSVSGIRYRNLMLGTLLGAGPGILLNIWLAGAVLEFLTSAGPSRSVDPRLMLPFLLLALALLAVRWWGRRVDSATASRKPPDNPA